MTRLPFPMAFKLHYRLHAADGRSVFFDLRKPVTLKLCEGEGEDGEGVGMFNWWTLSSTMKRGCGCSTGGL